MGVLEHLVPDDWQTIRRNFEKLERLFSLASQDGDGFGFKVAGIGVRFGTNTATFTASATSAGKVVAHGLGKTPVIAAGFPLGPLFGFAAGTLGATNMTITGFRTDNVATTVTVSFYWVAIG